MALKTVRAGRLPTELAAVGNLRGDHLTLSHSHLHFCPAESRMEALPKMHRTSWLLCFFCVLFIYFLKLPWWLSGKESSCQFRRCRRHGFDPWVRKIPWRRKWQPTPVFLPGESTDRGVWWATVHWVPKSQTRLSD